MTGSVFEYIFVSITLGANIGIIELYVCQ